MQYRHYDDDETYKVGDVLEWGERIRIKPAQTNVNTNVESFRGTVPPGMTLNTRTGEIAGTPTEIKNDVTEYNIIAHNQYGASEFRWRVVVADKKPQFLGSRKPDPKNAGETYADTSKVGRWGCLLGFWVVLHVD